MSAPERVILAGNPDRERITRKCNGNDLGEYALQEIQLLGANDGLGAVVYAQLAV